MEGGIDPYIAQIKKVQVRLALLPLFTGNVVLRARIDSPDIRLEQHPSGKNWNWEFLKDSEGSKTPTASPEEGSPAATEGNGFDIQVDELSIRDGQISYRDSGEEPQLFKNLNATITLDSLQGPFTIDASLNALGSPGKIKASVDSLDEDTPVHVDLTWQGHMFKAQGNWNHEALRFKGNLNVTTAPLPSLNVVTAKADLTANLKEAKLSKIAISSAQGKATGSANVRWEPSLFVTANLSGLPGQTSLKVTHKENTKGPHITLTSKSLKDLLPSLPTGSFKADFTLPLSPLEKSKVNVQGAKITWGQAHSTLKGSFSYKNPKDYRSNLTFDTSDLTAWARLFDLTKEQKNSIPASISIDTSGPLNKLATKLALSSGNNSLTANGTLNVTSESHSFTIGASIPDAQKFLSPLGIGGGVLDALTLDAKASLTPQQTKVSMSKASFSTGRADIQLTSDLTLKLSQTPKNINGSVVIIGLTFKTPSSSNDTSKEAASSKENTIDKAASSLSKDSMDLSALKDLNVSLSIQANQLPSNDLALKSLSVQLDTRGGKVELSPIQASVAQGEIKGQVNLNSNGHFSSDLSLVGLQMKPLLLAFTGMDDVTGTLEGNLSLTAKGKSLFDLASTLDGSLNLQVLEGTYHGFDLSAISKQLKNLKNLTGFLGLFAVGASGGETPFKQLGGHFDIKGGVITPNKVTLEAEVASAELTGQVNLPQWNADLETQLKLAEHPKFPGIGVDIKGPLSAISFGVNTDALESYFASEAISGLLGGVLGGGDSATGAAAGAVTGESKGTGDLLGDVVGNVLGGGAPVPTPQGVVGNVVGGLIGNIFGGD